MDLFAEIENKKKEKKEKKKKEKKSKDKKVKPLSTINSTNTQENTNDVVANTELVENSFKKLDISATQENDGDDDWLDEVGDDENAMTTSISRISKIEVAKKTKIVTKSVKQEDGTQKDEEVEVEVDEHGKAIDEQFDWKDSMAMTSSMIEKAKENKKQPEEEKKASVPLSEGVSSFAAAMQAKRLPGGTKDDRPPLRRRQKQYQTGDANQFPELGTAVQQEKGTPAGYTSVDNSKSGGSAGGFAARMKEKRALETSNKFGNLG